MVATTPAVLPATSDATSDATSHATMRRLMHAAPRAARRRPQARACAWVLLAAAAALVLAPQRAAAEELATVLAAAEARDPQLASARAGRDAAAEGVPLARSRLLPQASFDTTVRKLVQDTRQDSALGERDSRFDGPAGNRQISIRQPLFRARDIIGLEVGQLQAGIGELRAATALSNTWARAAGAWLEVLAAAAQRDVLAGLLASAERVLAQQQARAAAGEATRDAVAEAQGQMALARARLREAELNLTARQQGYVLATGLAPLALAQWRLPEALPDLPWGDDQAAVAYVSAANPELRTADQTALVGERRVAQARADHLPTIDAIASVSSQENDGANAVGSRFRTRSIGVQLSVPLFTSGGLSAAARQAQAFSIAAAADRDAFAQQLRLRVEAQWAAERGQRERITAAQELVAAAREQLSATEAALRAGQRTVGDVGSAAAVLANREADLAALWLSAYGAQLQILAQLPTADPAWAGWVMQATRLAQRRVD
jgi:outer membrane protein TolC